MDSALTDLFKETPPRTTTSTRKEDTMKETVLQPVGERNMVDSVAPSGEDVSDREKKTMMVDHGKGDEGKGEKEIPTSIEEAPVVEGGEREEEMKGRVTVRRKTTGTMAGGKIREEVVGQGTAAGSKVDNGEGGVGKETDVGSKVDNGEGGSRKVRIRDKKNRNVTEIEDGEIVRGEGKDGGHLGVTAETGKMKPQGDAGLKGDARQKSWSAVVQNKSSLPSFDVRVEEINGVATIAIPDEVFEDVTPLWEDLVTGKFPVAAPNVAIIHKIVNRIWPLGGNTTKVDVFIESKNIVKFRIPDKGVRNRVLRRGMWNIMGMPMAVSKCSPVVEEAQPEMRSLPSWVILKNVPYDMYNRKGLSYLASAVGVAQRLHPETENCKNFEEAKVFVNIDLTKQLPKFYHFTSKTGLKVDVEYVYPWLPPRCTKCQKWGHLVVDCRSKDMHVILQETHDTLAVEKSRVEENSSTVNEVTEPVLECTGVEIEHVTEKEDTSTEIITETQGVQLVGLKTADETNGYEESVQFDVVAGASATDGVGHAWTEVTPSKAGRHSNLKVVDKSPFISPSRYYLLHKEEMVGDAVSAEVSRDEELEDTNFSEDGGVSSEVEKEEGEILRNEDANRGSRKERELPVARSQLPRSSKSSHKFLSGNSTKKVSNTQENGRGSRKGRKSNQ